MYQPRHFPPPACLPYRQPIQHRRMNYARQIAVYYHAQYRYVHTLTRFSTGISSAVRYRPSYQTHPIANTDTTTASDLTSKVRVERPPPSPSSRSSSAASSCRFRPHAASCSPALVQPRPNQWNNLVLIMWLSIPGSHQFTYPYQMVHDANVLLSDRCVQQ